MNALGALQHEARHNMQTPNLLADSIPEKLDNYSSDVEEAAQSSGSFNAAVHRITGDIIDSPYKKSQYIRKAMSDPDFMSRLTPEERRDLVAQFGVYQDGFFSLDDDASRESSNRTLNRHMRYAPIYQ